jgi:hypothetical protein
MSDKLIFKDVWKKDNAAAESDALAVWTAEGALPKSADPQRRVKELCVLGYEDGKVVAISTCQISYFEYVRETMAIFRVFIPREFRQRGLVISLTYALHDAMERYALAKPGLRIGGTAAIVVVRGTMDKPVASAGMVLVGYTIDNHPVLVKWFEHFKLDEDAARARDPKKIGLTN